MKFNQILTCIVSAASISLAATSVSAADLTPAFQQLYSQGQSLPDNEQTLLKGFDIYLVPGIMSESFLDDDGRSKFSFAFATGEYLEAQRRILTEKYGFAVKRLPSSSRSPEEIRHNIRSALADSRLVGRKAVFMVHSLAGLALLEELVTNPQEQAQVAGVIFFQSPLRGTPLADLYLQSPFSFEFFLRPLLPFLNVSEETLRYLGTQSRAPFMKAQATSISQLVAKVPVLTVAGVANGFTSIFQPLVNVMADGCLQSKYGICVVPILFEGPYDLSDGLVPLESTKIENADQVVLLGADHGETILTLPFNTYNRGRATEALFSLLAKKITAAAP